jgi:tRNA A37 threonylcarbamoyladenosine modification protein TsaB
MKIRIEIKQGMIGILLVDKSKILDRISFPEERNLSEKLLPIVDEFLKKNRLSVQDIERMEL